MIKRLSIAFEDFLGSLIAPQVMPPCHILILQYHLPGKAMSTIGALNHSATVWAAERWHRRGLQSLIYQVKSKNKLKTGMIKNSALIFEILAVDQMPHREKLFVVQRKG